ncbi:MAG: hypothetical protein RL753_542 [Bacteroidota bacterium]
MPRDSKTPRSSLRVIRSTHLYVVFYGVFEELSDIRNARLRSTLPKTTRGAKDKRCRMRVSYLWRKRGSRNVSRRQLKVLSYLKERAMLGKRTWHATKERWPFTALEGFVKPSMMRNKSMMRESQSGTLKQRESV